MAVIQYESDVSVRGRVLIDGGLPHQFLKADGSLDSNTYALASSVHNPVTIGTANGLSLSNQQLSLGLASSGVTGALSGTDWNTFNGKFNTPTGLTTKYLPKWNGSEFVNSKIFDNSVGISFGGASFFGGYEFLISAFGNNTIYLGTADGTQNPRAYISHQTISNQPQKVVLGSAFSTGQATASWYLENGRFIVGSLVDNLIDIGQFNGTISASPATTANQVVVMSQINGKANADGSNVSGTWGINISGNSNKARAINIGTPASISDLNLSVSDHAVRFDTFYAQAANKPISVNNANGVISFLMNHGLQYGKQIAFADNDDLYIRKLSGGTYGNWLSLLHSGNISSQSVNYANSAGSAPNANNQNSSYLVTPGDGNGIKFWASDYYKISMGVGSLYQYGPVTDYSIKMQMNDNSPDRGFTWGRIGIAPIAALNATSGNFQTTGNMAASAFFQFSDIRLKTVIPHQHVSVENIAPITYLWKDPKKRASPQVGYSAQEVQKVMPYAVSVADDGMLSVNYIQVLVAKVAELELKLKKHGLE